VGALLSMSISASVGTGTLVASGALPVHELPGSWAVWWAGEAMGVLVVTPFVLSLVLPRHRPRSARWRQVEAAVLFVLLGWAAWRFRQRGAAPAALLVVLTTSWAAAKGAGPFGAGTLLEKMVMLQAFNATVAFCSFFWAQLAEAQ
jgi:integral membrane sensor domain MASE1